MEGGTRVDWEEWDDSHVRGGTYVAAKPLIFVNEVLLSVCVSGGGVVWSFEVLFLSCRVCMVLFLSCRVFGVVLVVCLSCVTCFSSFTESVLTPTMVFRSVGGHNGGEWRGG